MTEKTGRRKDWKFTLQRIAPLVLLGGFLVFYTWLLLTYFVPVTGGVDQNGYHTCGRMFNLEGVFYQKTVDDLQYVGHMWVVNERGEFYPKYPPFYPFLSAAMNGLLGPGGGFYATIWGAILAAGGMYVLARFWMGRYYALAAAALLGLSPVFATLAISKNSHTPSVAFLVWGMAAFLQGATHRKSHWNLLWTMLGGLLIGYTVGIRYTDFLMIFVPAAYALLLIPGRWKWKTLCSLGLGAAIPYAALALFHWQAYGAPWRSGYSLTSESSAFAPEFMFENLLIYLPEFFLLVIGPVGIFALLLWHFHWKRAAFWCVWLLPTFLLYLAYYWAPDGESTGAMRFLMPLLPALIVLSLLSLRRIRFRLGSRAAVAVTFVFLIALQGVWSWTRITRMMEPRAVNDLQRQVQVENAIAKIPEGAVVIADSGLLNELDFERRWQLYPTYLLNPREVDKVVERSLGAQAAGLQKVRAEALKKALGGKNYGELHAYIRDFFEAKQKEGREVYFYGRPHEVNQFKRIFYRYFELESAGMVAGTRPRYLLRDVKPEASRYRAKAEPVALPVYEIVKLGARRKKTLPAADAESQMIVERNELWSRVNPSADPEVRRDLERLDTIREEILNLRRAIAAEKAKKKK